MASGKLRLLSPWHVAAMLVWEMTTGGGATFHSRKHVRVPVEFGAVALLAAGPDDAFTAQMSDLSRGGARLSDFGRLLPLRAELRLQIELPDQDHLRVHARVAHNSDEGVGLEFQNIAAIDEQR